MPSDLPSPGPGPRPASPPKRRPDARPTRIVLGLGTAAALSVVAASLVRFPVTDAADTSALVPEPRSTAHEEVVHRIRYVQLKRGEHAPAGATVIRHADPTPRIVVRTVPAPRQATTTPRRRSVARSRQSGR